MQIWTQFSIKNISPMKNNSGLITFFSEYIFVKTPCPRNNIFVFNSWQTALGAYCRRTNSNIFKLPPFPRNSETGKTNLRDIAAILGEHLFQHSLFENDQFVMLTLMKGDKVVELAEILSNQLLLIE